MTSNDSLIEQSSLENSRSLRASQQTRSSTVLATGFIEMSQKALHGTACKGCRRRGRKCDRTLPTCLSCERRGVVCEGYVTRWPGVAARGKLAGRSIPVSSSPITTSKGSSSRARRTLSSVAEPLPADLNKPTNHDLVQHDEEMMDKGGIHSTSWPADNVTNIDDNEITKLANHCKTPSSPLFNY